MRVSACVIALGAGVALNSALAQGIGEIVRIPAPISPRCINSTTDEVTVTLRRIITQRTGGLFTSDNQAGVAVVTTLNADGSPPTKTPSVSLINIASAPKGQVMLLLEYPVASQLLLTQEKSPTSEKLVTKNMQLDLYLARVRSDNTFGKILTVASQFLGKLPIPANPYATVANQVLQFANQTITNETSREGALQFASVTLQFSRLNIPDLEQCTENDYQSTGAIAIIGAGGAHNVPPLPLGNLDKRYCWKYASKNTYEVLYAAKPRQGCQSLAESAYEEVPNDYVMLLVSAASVAKPTKGGVAAEGSFRSRDLAESRKLCEAMGVDLNQCGVKDAARVGP
jgi:hypothetical protein